MGNKATLLGKSAVVAMIALSSHQSFAAEKDSTVFVSVDQAKVFRIDEAASTVIIGNPAIADVSVQDRSTLVVTGKAFGSTNLIILDKDNEPVVDEKIVVRYSEEDTVTITRNTTQQTYSCTPICNPTLRVGDSSDFFDGVKGQVTGLNDLAAGAAGSKNP